MGLNKKDGRPASTSRTKTSWAMAEADEMLRLLEDLAQIAEGLDNCQPKQLNFVT